MMIILRTLLWAFLVTLISQSALSQSVCITMDAGQTTVTSGPFPLSANNDCAQYPPSVTLLSASDSRYTTYLANQTAEATAAANIANAKAAVIAAQTTGITLSCTTYTSFNGFTFAVAPSNITYLSSLTGHYAANAAGFPNATALPNIIDTSNGAHPFATAAQLKAVSSILFGYAEALQTYLVKVTAGQSPAMPPTTSGNYGSC